MLEKASEYSKFYIESHPELKEQIEYGLNNGLVFNFGNDEFEKLNSLSYVVIFDDVINLFKEGYNLGNCSEFAKLLSYAYDSSKIAIGYFKPSYNGQNGHAWMECGNYIYDTTLLLKIDKEYANVLGYVKLKEYDPMTNSLYRNRKQIYNEKYNVIKGK